MTLIDRLKAATGQRNMKLEWRRRELEKTVLATSVLAIEAYRTALQGKDANADK